MYFNTTNLAEDELQDARAQAHTQNEQVLEILETEQKPMGASEITEKMHEMGTYPPLTSVRRALSVLKEEGRVVKTTNRVMGTYGKKEYAWVARGSVRWQ